MENFIANYWQEALYAVLIFLVGFIAKKIRAYAKKQDSLELGVLAILHDRLWLACTYYIKNDCITAEEMKNLEYLYKGYAGLGGNGTGKELYERCKKLRIEV